MKFDRITLDPAIMGGKPCIRGMRVTVGMILGLLANGHSRERILQAYPYLEAEDIEASLAYAAWRLEEREEGTALALTHAAGPSVFQIRGQQVLPENSFEVVLSALRQHENDLLAGALLVFEENRSRVRILPFE